MGGGKKGGKRLFSFDFSGYEAIGGGKKGLLEKRGKRKRKETILKKLV